MKKNKNSVFLHVDMDAFFASVEQRDHPAYRGKPLVVGSPPDKRGVISASSYEARTYGIYSAMPSSIAYKKCPHAIFVPVNMKHYKQISQQLFSIMEEYTPFVEPLSVDEAFLEVSGSIHLFGEPAAMARKIKDQIQQECGLTASIGVANNKFLAKLASDLEKPDGLTLVPFESEAIRLFLAPLDVARIWGVGRVLEKKLRSRGIETIGDLQQWSKEALNGVVGKTSAEHLNNLAFGRDERPIAMPAKEKSISREYTFNEDCEDPEQVVAKMKMLVSDVGRRLRKRHSYAAGIQLKVRWAGFDTITRQMKLDETCCDDFTLYEKAFYLWNKIPRKRPVRLIGFGVSRIAEKEGSKQLSLFEIDSGKDKKRNLSDTVDQIREHYGTDSIKWL